MAKNPFINDGSLENQRFLNRQQQDRARAQQAQADRNRQQDADRKVRHRAMAEAWATRPSYPSPVASPDAASHVDRARRESKGSAGSTYQENKGAIWMIAVLLFFFGFWLADTVLHLRNPYFQFGGGVVSALCAEVVFRLRRWIVGVGLIVVAIYFYLRQGK